MQIETVKIRDIEFGKGMPKVCVPIVGTTKEQILETARQIPMEFVDCVELRIDWFEEVMNREAVLNLGKELRAVLGGKVLLFTFRSKEEGGEKSIAKEDYIALYQAVCQSGDVDLIDVEAFKWEGILEEISEFAHQNGVYVVGSNHDFEKTPSEQEMVKRLQYMDQKGADMPKIAVMPNDQRDVLTLLSATLKYQEEGGKKPIITMAMDKVGLISRLTGEVFGSALTFAACGQGSAPGQIPVQEVKEGLTLLHKYV